MAYCIKTIGETGRFLFFRNMKLTYELGVITGIFHVPGDGSMSDVGENQNVIKTAVFI